MEELEKTKRRNARMSSKGHSSVTLTLCECTPDERCSAGIPKLDLDQQSGSPPTQAAVDPDQASPSSIGSAPRPPNPPPLAASLYASASHQRKTRRLSGLSAG
jgi:hypothetical protein